MLTKSERSDFVLLKGKLRIAEADPCYEPSRSNLHELLLFARDVVFEEPDDTLLRLLARYSYDSYELQPVNDATATLTRACRRVCRIDTNVGPPVTGVLVGPDLVVTVCHGLRPIGGEFPRAIDVEVVFDRFRFEDQSVREVPCSVATNAEGRMDIVASSPGSVLDYVLFRLDPMVGLHRLDYRPRRRRGWMDGHVARVLPQGDVVVLQHPGGRYMKYSDGTVSQDTSNLNAGWFRYDAETESGSSGSAVLNSARQLVGIHNGYFNGTGMMVSWSAIVADLGGKRLPKYPPSRGILDAFGEVTLDLDFENSFLD